MLTKPSDWLAQKTNMQPARYWLFSFLSLGIYPFVFRQRLTDNLHELIHLDYPPYLLRIYLHISVVAIIGYLISVFLVAVIPGFLYLGLICVFTPSVLHRVWAFKIREILYQYYPTVYGISLKINPVSLFFFPVTTLLFVINTTLKDTHHV